MRKARWCRRARERSQSSLSSLDESIGRALLADSTADGDGGEPFLPLDDGFARRPWGGVLMAIGNRGVGPFRR